MKRKEKIKLLKGTATTEQRPKHTITFYSMDETTGLYFEHGSEKNYSKHDFFSRPGLSFITNRKN